MFIIMFIVDVDVDIDVEVNVEEVSWQSRQFFFIVKSCQF